MWLPESAIRSPHAAPLNPPNTSEWMTPRRAHANIERRRGHFFLVDHSANGSYVTLEGKPEMHVHREELTLLGHGWITFGRPRAEALQVVEFRCVETWRPQAAAAPAPATASA